MDVAIPYKEEIDSSSLAPLAHTHTPTCAHARIHTHTHTVTGRRGDAHTILRLTIAFTSYWGSVASEVALLASSAWITNCEGFCRFRCYCSIATIGGVTPSHTESVSPSLNGHIFTCQWTCRSTSYSLLHNSGTHHSFTSFRLLSFDYGSVLLEEFQRTPIHDVYGRSSHHFGGGTLKFIH